MNVIAVVLLVCMLTTTFGFPVSMVLVDVFVSRERDRRTDRQTEKRGKGERILLFLYDFEKDIIKMIIL